MKLKLRVILTLTLSSFALSGCAPLVIAGMGAGTAVAVDKASEDKQGGDGIF